MKRRDFLKGLAATSTGVAVMSGIGALPTKAFAAKEEDFGEVKSIKVHCISETSWFDNATLGSDISKAGGVNSNQYDIAWTVSNAGGFSALIEVEALNGKKTKYLLDTGWGTEWMDYVFAKDGIDKMLKSKEISTLIISHDHFDHFWGIESTLKHQPDIKIYFPGTAMENSRKLLKGAEFSKSQVKNKIPHKGELVVINKDKLCKIQDGMAVYLFDAPCSTQVRGENVLYFKVKDKGYVTVTGCCHPGIMTLMNYATRNFKDGSKHYGCYGGLHISVMENWDPKFDDLIIGIKNLKMSQIACNHCTGWIWAEKAAAAGLPIVKGTDKNKSYKRMGTIAKAKTSNVFTGNGDTVIFG